MTSWNRPRVSLAVLLSSLVLSACGPRTPVAEPTNTVPCVDTPADCPALHSPAETSEEAKIRNVILLIGDGMGPQQIGLLELYARYAQDPRYPERTSHIGRMIHGSKTTVVISTPADGLVNESATGATQLATGVPTKFGYLGLNEAGEPVDSAVDLARSLGMRTGIISDTRLTHATPASFGAHVHDRWDENHIAEQLVESGTDVMLSGGWRYFLPKSAATSAQRGAVATRYGIPEDQVRSTRADERDLLAEASAAGYTIATSVEALRAAEGSRLLGLFAASGMQTGTQWLQERDEEIPSQPSLAELFRVGVRFLNQDPERGFFLMLEGGQIDWAGHATKAQLLLHEMLRFDETVAEVMRFAQEDGETAVILTADHETGGFSIFYDRKGPPGPEIFEDLDAYPNYVRFATSAHTHTPVYGVFNAPESLTRPIPSLLHQTEVGEVVNAWVRIAGE